MQGCERGPIIAAGLHPSKGPQVNTTEGAKVLGMREMSENITSFYSAYLGWQGGRYERDDRDLPNSVNGDPKMSQRATARGDMGAFILWSMGGGA